MTDQFFVDADGLDGGRNGYREKASELETLVQRIASLSSQSRVYSATGNDKDGKAFAETHLKSVGEIHDGIKVWDTLAIAEYLNELKPDAKLMPADRADRARCRAISGEMHSGFSNLRSALPMNLKAHYPGFKVWAGAQADIDRVTTIWRDCLATSKGPYLFGKEPCMADAMYAPVVTRFLTYDVKLDAMCAAYCKAIMALPHMEEWIVGAKAEPDELEELDVEF